MTNIQITKQDLSSQHLTEAEQQVIIDAWNEYCEDNDVFLNGDNNYAKFAKNEVVRNMSRKLKDELVFQCEIYSDHDLTREDDKQNLIETMKHALKKECLIPNAHCCV